MNILQKRKMTKEFISMAELPQHAEGIKLKLAVDELL